MDGLAEELLIAALRYLVARLRALATPDALSGLIDGSVPQPATEVEQRIAAGLAHAEAASTALDARSVVTAAKAASDAILEFHEAAKLLGVADLGTAAEKVMAAASPGGIITQLALPAPDAKPIDRGLEVAWKKESPTTLEILEIASLRLGIRISGDVIGVTVAARGVRIDLGEMASAVVELLIGGGGAASTDLLLTIDGRGLTAEGSLGPIALPARLAAQIVDLDGLALSLKPQGADLALEIRGTVGVDIAGVVHAQIDGAGVRLVLDLARILGGQQPFRPPEVIPPTGVALALEAGPVSGGGSLMELDGGYGGTLDLSLGPVAITAFGLLRDVDGVVSFVAVMSVRFVVPIELGLLFTLNAVGGVVGFGVRVDPDAIASGMKDGVLDRLMFPDDIRKAAPAILRTLAHVFPRQPGGFVVGPMARLGWGRPVSLFTLDVGVILSVPDPVLLIIGRARAVIPDERAPIIELRAAVLVQIGGGKFLMRAELYDSRIGFITVYGGIGMLARFDEPTVVISAGGFHPTYPHKPAELSDLSRIGAEMSPPIGLQLRVQGYVALTPNTVQFGGALEVAYSVAVAAVRGNFSLDAIIQFDPFGFAVDVTASAHVEAFGISLIGVSLALHLSGPSPWIVSGTGRITLPWPLPDPSISVGPVEFGGGSPPPAAPPAVKALNAVASAMNRKDAWQRADRRGQRAPVRLRADGTPTAPGDVVIEPWGLVRTSQRVFPLEMTLDRAGQAPVEPVGCRIRIDGRVRVGDAVSEVPSSPVVESFPVGQFMALTKDEQLAAPEFEDRQGGVVIDPAGAETVAAALLPFTTEATLDYEDFWRDAAGSQVGEQFEISEWLAALILQTGPAGSCGLRVADTYRPQQAERIIAVRPVSEVRITDVDTGAESAAFAPWSDAVRSARSVRGGIAAMTRVGAS